MTHPFQLILIGALSAALALALIDAGRTRIAMRDFELQTSARIASGFSQFSLPVRIDSVSPELRELEYTVRSKKLGTEERFRTRIDENAVINAYRPERSPDGSITSFTRVEARELADIAPGTTAIAHFSLDVDGGIVLHRLFLGIEFPAL